MQNSEIKWGWDYRPKTSVQNYCWIPAQVEKWHQLVLKRQNSYSITNQPMPVISQIHSKEERELIT